MLDSYPCFLGLPLGLFAGLFLTVFLLFLGICPFSTPLLYHISAFSGKPSTNIFSRILPTVSRKVATPPRHDRCTMKLTRIGRSIATILFSASRRGFLHTGHLSFILVGFFLSFLGIGDAKSTLVQSRYLILVGTISKVGVNVSHHCGG